MRDEAQKEGQRLSAPDANCCWVLGPHLGQGGALPDTQGRTSPACAIDRPTQAEVGMLSCLVNKTCAVASLPRMAPQVKESCRWC